MLSEMPKLSASSLPVKTMKQRVKTDREYWARAHVLLPSFMEERYEIWDGPFGGALAQAILKQFEDYLAQQDILPEPDLGINYGVFYSELRRLGYTLPKSTDWAKTRVTGIRKRDGKNL